MELLNTKKATRPGTLEAHIEALMKGKAELDDTRARIADLTSREAELQAEMAGSQDPDAVARLYDQLVGLEEANRRDKYLLPAQARAQALSVAAQALALCDEGIQGAQRQSALHSVLIDDVEKEREALEAKEQS